MERLQSILRRIDGRGYKAYKDLRGRYRFDDFDLQIDHVQGDPFAAPSRLSLHVPAEVADLPGDLWEDRRRRIATADYLTRRIAAAIPRVCRGARGSGKSGRVRIDDPGQEVLERTSCEIDAGAICARVEVGLPASGRRILAREAEAILCTELPDLVDEALVDEAHDLDAMRAHADAVEDAGALRARLAGLGLVAFVAEGAVLPRRSGVDDRPLPDGVPFGPVPEAMAVSVDLPRRGRVRGLGVPRGVTLIVGGGYHGKSTLLDALARGVYDHVPGDGRELVVTSARATTVRAEDGRRVEKVGIDAFIDDLPNGADTTRFCTERASGSTSQAAGIMEALELGADLLLIDEDTSASNFLVRDHRMQRLVAREQEPISPFVDRVRQLLQERSVSTVMVLGGSSDYFEVSDRVVQMDAYRPRDVTERVAEIVRELPNPRRREVDDRPFTVHERVPLRRSIDPSRGRRPEKVRAMATRAIAFGEEEIDISLLEQIVDPSQTRAIADALLLIHRRLADDRRSVGEIAAALDEIVAEQGLGGYAAPTFGDRAAVRSLDVGAALNRLRSLTVEQRS